MPSPDARPSDPRAMLEGETDASNACEMSDRGANAAAMGVSSPGVAGHVEMRIPAIVAVIYAAKVPPIIARNPYLAKSARRSGTSEPIPPI